MTDLAERYLRLTPSGLIAVGFAALGFGLGRVIASRAVMLLVWAAILLLIACFALGRRRLDVAARRSEFPSRVRVGQTVDVELTLTAARRISTVVLEEHLHDHLGRPMRVALPVLPSGAEVKHSYSLAPNTRGVYEVGPLTATWSDPFGLTRHTATLAEPVKVIVHPTTERVADRVMSREWEDPPLRPPVSKPWPTGFEFYGMRDYVNGDDPRRIMWRAVARTGQYLVRESEQGITDRVTLILDTDSRSHSPGRPSDTFETAVRVAASLGVHHLQDFTVSLDSNREPLATGLRGRRSTIPLLDQLAAVEMDTTPLSNALDRVLTTGRRNAHYVIITPDVDNAAATRLEVLAGRGTSMLIVVVTWDDTDPLTVHRVGSLGCNVVEVDPAVPLARAFRRVAARKGHR